MMKDRIEQRDFGHVRHHCCRKNLTEPTGLGSLSWLEPKQKEFWRTDVDRVLKREEENRRARQKKVLRIRTNDEVWRRHDAQKMRDKKYLEASEKMQKVRYKSSAPHIPIGEHTVKWGV